MKFFHDAADIILDRSFRQRHGLSDLSVAVTFGDVVQDSLLLVAEPLTLRPAASVRSRDTSTCSSDASLGDDEERSAVPGA
jgi:hypothetical protein